MKKTTAPKKATPAPATTSKTGSSGMMISGKSTGTANPTSTSALGKMPAAGTQKKPEVKSKQEEVKTAPPK